MIEESGQRSGGSGYDGDSERRTSLSTPFSIKPREGTVFAREWREEGVSSHQIDIGFEFPAIELRGERVGLPGFVVVFGDDTLRKIKKSHCFAYGQKRAVRESRGLRRGQMR